MMEYAISYGVEQNANNWGNPQTNPFGNAIRKGWNPLGGANYEWFPFEPYYYYNDFFAYQQVSVQPTEMLYGDYFGYRGILPLSLQAVSPEPYPYQAGYPYNVSA